MYTNELLEEKYRVQRLLAKEANYDLKTYIENVERKVKEAEMRYGIKFKYVKVNTSEREHRSTPRC